MIRGGFLSIEERAKLTQIVRRPGEDHGVARRANAILLLDDGKSCEEIAEFLYLDDDTVRGWYKRYEHGGFDELETFDWKGGVSRLSAAREEELDLWLEGRLCRSTDEVCTHVWRRDGIWFSQSGCIKLLHRMGFEYTKPSSLPAVANEQEQARFIAEYEALQKNLPEDGV